MDDDDKNDSNDDDDDNNNDDGDADDIRSFLQKNGRKPNFTNFFPGKNVA